MEFEIEICRNSLFQRKMKLKEKKNSFYYSLKLCLCCHDVESTHSWLKIKPGRVVGPFTQMCADDDVFAENILAAATIAFLTKIAK